MTRPSEGGHPPARRTIGQLVLATAACPPYSPGEKQLVPDTGHRRGGWVVSDVVGQGPSGG
ncbi:hypothetical protein ACQB60_32300 [Actinomycetota bacterium Odt1-20B]